VIERVLGKVPIIRNQLAVFGFEKFSFQREDDMVLRIEKNVSWRFDSFRYLKFENLLSRPPTAME
jgi:hypothetical protein